MPFATSEGGVKIHYELEGSGPPLVLMHGLGGNLESWRGAGYAQPLAEEFQLVLIDSRGRGQSDYPRTQEAYELRTRVMDLASVLNDAGLEKAHFMGYGTGAWVGWGIPIYMPQRFKSLALGGFGPAADPFAGGSVEEHFGELWHKFADEEQEVVRLMFAETARFGGARQALKTTQLPIMLWAGEQDPHFATMLGAASMLAHGSFFPIPHKDHRQAFQDADAREVVVQCAAEFFAEVENEVHA
ncbi:MAG: alpha/beta hydrolase [Dehalococcoidia bacterium]